MKAHNIILNNEHYPLLEAENNTGNSGLKLSTGDGYIMLGPLNTGHAHIETDRSNFYFNKELRVDSGVIGSYNEDLYLRRASNSSHQIQISTTGITNSLKTTFSAGLNGQAILLSGAQNFDNIKDIGFYSLYNVSASGSVNAPFQYGTMISTNSNASGGMGMQLAHERTGGGFYVRGMNDSGDTWYAWDEIWTSGTDGSGSGLDADLLDGYHLSTTRNSANTVPVRDGNGYLNLGWINTTSGNTTSNISDIYINTGDNYVRKASKSHFISNLGLWTSTNDGSGSGLDADTVDGKHASDFMADEFLDAAYVDFTVNGDADTYYPVSIRGGGKMAFQMYSISRQYNWTAPNTWNTSTHRGGLTLTWQNSGDGFWGGNDHDIRIIKWDETYTTMVAGMQGSVGGGGTNAGVVVWLRGGGALYRFHGPQASAGDVNIHLSSVTASNSTVFAPRSLNTSTRDSELLPKYPVRNQSELYDNNNRVWHVGNDGSNSGLDADLLDGQQGSYYRNAGNLNAGTIPEARLPTQSKYLRSDTDDTTSGILTTQQVRWGDGPGTYSGNPRSATIGYSGGNYGQIGYGWIPTATSGVHTSKINDLQSRIDLYNGIVVYGSGTSQSVNSTVSWTELLDCRTNAFQYKNNNIWHAGNDGSGSGLDADLLDGQQGSYYRNAGNLNAGTIPEARLPTQSKYLRSDTNDTTSGYLEAEGFVGNGSVLRISHPRDATYHVSSSSVTGAIKVTLPVTWTNTMMRMTIKVYDYAGSEAFEVMCGGYNYDPSSAWINTFAYILCDPSVDRNFNVRFGHDGSKCAIYIGETTSTWSYLKVAVTEFEAGHSNYAAETWNDGWDISLVTSLGTITKTESNPQIGKYVAGHTVWHAGNDGPGSGLDADTLDGVQAASFLRSDADDTFSGSYLTMGGDFKFTGSLYFTNTNDTSKTFHINDQGRLFTEPGTAASPSYSFNTDSDSGMFSLGSNAVGFGTGGTQRFKINSNGLLLTGSSSLYVNGQRTITNSRNLENIVNITNTDGYIEYKRTAAAPAIFNRLGTGGASGTSRGEIVNFKAGSSKVGRIGYAQPYGGIIYLAGGQTTSYGVGVYQFSTTSYFQPCTHVGADLDDIMTCGNSAARWTDVYSTNGTIQTSDRNEKQDIQALTDAETRVATACKGLIRRYRWISSVEEKGDNARYHFGAIAQDVEDAFTAEGLNAGDYALFIKNHWWEHEGTSYPTAEAAPTGAVEKIRRGIRYNQLLAFIISAL